VRSTLPHGLRLVGLEDTEHRKWMKYMLGNFGVTVTDDAAVSEFLQAFFPATRAISVLDDYDYVATASAIDRELTLPGGDAVRMAAMTGITVSSTARRQGLLRSMLAHLHQRAADEECPVAGLYCSEWPIYGRFGYGPASWFDTLTVDARTLEWRENAPNSQLRPRHISAEAAKTLADKLHAAHAEMTPGEVRQPAQYWNRFILDNSSATQVEAILGVGPWETLPRHWVAVGDRGLVSYRLSSRWTELGVPNCTLSVTDFLAIDPHTTAALWRHLASVDLVTEIRVPFVPTDDCLQWWVVDGRRLQRQRRDGLWLRPLNVKRLLETLRWSADGHLILRIHDPQGYACGTFELSVDSGQASCKRSTAEPDLDMDVAALGTILLGGASAKALVRSGIIQSGQTGAAQLWDVMATPDRVAFSSSRF
jgi:predicted acetyltransferase